MRRLAALFFLAGCAVLPSAADRLEADLKGPHSATQVLTQWCAQKAFADFAVVRAVRDPVEVPADAAVRAVLQAGPNETVRYRRVKLTCGGHVLSQADNWYRPSRLTPEMNRVLDTTDTSFGTVVKPLDFHRTTLAVTRPRDGSTILQLKAVLIAADGAPFSLVVENYTSELN